MIGLNERIDGSQAVEFERDDTLKDRNLIDYDFEIGNLEYTIQFEKEGQVASLAFEMRDEDNPRGTYKQVDVGMDVAVKVFHTVWMTIKDYLKSFPVKFIQFSAKSDDQSRVKFYRTLAWQLAKETGNRPRDVEESHNASNYDFKVPVAQKRKRRTAEGIFQSKPVNPLDI